MSTKLVFTRQEAAEAVGVSEDTIKKSVASGALKAKRSARNDDGDGVGKYLISHAALMAWFDALPDA